MIRRLSSIGIPTLLKKVSTLINVDVKKLILNPDFLRVLLKLILVIIVRLAQTRRLVFLYTEPSRLHRSAL